MAKVKVSTIGYSIESLYKWDTGQELEIHGLNLTGTPQVHYAHKGDLFAIVQSATMEAGGVIRARIPDSMLRSTARLYAYVCTQQGDEFKTICKIAIPVTSRAKPADYTPEAEDYTYVLADVQTEAVTLEPGASATVEKVMRDGKLTLRFGVPRGQNGEDLLEADLREVYARMEMKGDNLEFDPVEGKLYLTSGGVRVSDGITIVTSGGPTNNAVVSLQNVSGWAYKTISPGASCPVTFTWSSLENGVETGPGMLEITNNDDQKYLAETEQGTITMDLAPYLSADSNVIKVSVTDTYGTVRTLTFNVVVQSIVSYLSFYNEDGSSVLQIVECKDGADGDYTAATPTKESTAQYAYTFAGWSRTIGGAVDPDVMKNVTADRSLYAVFTETVRTYNVTWMNGSTTLETDTNVPYGTVPTYDGADPTSTDPDYVWNGWSPAVGAITGDTTYTAQFKGTSYVYAKLIDHSISGAYTNDIVASIGNYAFASCSKLTTVDFPAATSIGTYAFNSCSNLTALILRSETMCTLSDTSAFNNSAIKSGTGYIYVPRALVDSYKAASGWSTYANQFRAIEDYPDICGGESA